MAATNRKRILPDWMKTNFPMVIPAENCIVQIEKLKIDRVESVVVTTETKSIQEPVSKEIDSTAPLPAKRYVTRSSISNQTTVMREEKEQLKIVQKPAFIEYKGKIEYLTDFYDIAYSADNLLKWVNQQATSERIPIAFDMEWPFSFQTGPGRTAVIQLCADTDLCFVFQIFNLKKLPAAVVQLLTHDKVCLHGVNIKNDCRKLERDFPEVNAQKMIDSCLDLGVYCNEVMNTGGRWSMERLVWHICRLKINKDKKVRMSQWHVMPLTYDQQLYAAIDVYISQVMYHKIRQREIAKEEETQEFLKEFGERAFKEIERLQ